MKRSFGLLAFLLLLLGLCVWAPGALTRYQEARALAAQAEASLETARVARAVAWGNAALAWALAAVALVAVVVAATAVGYAVWTTRRAALPPARKRKWASGPFAYWRQADDEKVIASPSADPLELLVRLETLRLLREVHRSNTPALPPHEIGVSDNSDEDNVMDSDWTAWGF